LWIGDDRSREKTARRRESKAELRIERLGNRERDKGKVEISQKFEKSSREKW